MFAEFIKDVVRDCLTEIATCIVTPRKEIYLKLSVISLSLSSLSLSNTHVLSSDARSPKSDRVIPQNRN